MTEESENLKPRLVETEPTDVFNDLEALRKTSALSVTKRELLTVVPVDRPPSDGYFRVNEEPEMRLEATIYRERDGKDRAVYFVLPGMRDHHLLVSRIRRVLLVCTYSWPSRQIGLWPVPIDDTGWGNPWWASAWAAYETALKSWVQMSAGENQYTVYSAEGTLPDPVWPDKSLSELLKIGFRDRIINHDDTPIMRRLRGLE
jgi:hypothetical protein